MIIVQFLLACAVISCACKHIRTCPLPWLTVCGVARYPKKITRALIAADAKEGTKKVEKR